jgi:acyl-CoA synthetase (AMP-forming)/AMP-acid ligase II
MVLADVVERNARLRRSEAAFVFEGRTLTHERFAERSFALGNALLRLGLSRQARVAVLAENRPEYFEIFAGVGAAGMITVNLNWRLAVPELTGIIADCEPQILIFDGPSEAKAALLRHAPGIRWLVALDSAPDWARSYEEMIGSEDTSRPGVEVDPEDIESLIYTSGTTGRPKGVMISHRALLAAASVIAWEGEARTDDRMLIVMPLFHIGGKIEQMAFWLAGATTVLHRSFDPAAILHSFAQDGVTAAHLAPTMVARLLDHPDLDATAYSRLRVIHYASAPMAVPLLRRAMEAFGPIFLQIYGMTECITVSILKPFQHRPDGTPDEVQRLSSAGQPCFGVSARIVRPDGTGCGPGELGEVAVRSEGLMSGYWNGNALTLAAVRDGWFRTGDIGFLDRDGFLFIADRAKDMIISGGENIYSREVEDALMSHPAVREVAVTGVPDPEWGESVKAWIVPRDGAEPTPAALIDHCRSLIASYKKPRFIEFTTDLPRLFNGKVDKKALRARTLTPDGSVARGAFPGTA